MLSLFSFFPLVFSVLYIVTCRSLNRILGDWLVWSSIFATYSPTEMTLPIVRLQRQSPKSSHDFHQFRPILQPRVCLHLLIFQDPKVTLSFFRRPESSNYKKNRRMKTLFWMVECNDNITIALAQSILSEYINASLFFWVNSFL